MLANRATWSWNVAGSAFALLYGLLAELGDYRYIAVDQFVAGTWPDNNPECVSAAAPFASSSEASKDTAVMHRP